jgi:thiamine pyrophosphate-dependent acetolactate synthase large subunit-like protein
MFRGRCQSSDLVEVNYAEIARTMGCNGTRADHAERTRATILDVIVTRNPAANHTLDIKQGVRVA